MQRRIVFVYAVDGGLFASLFNYAHKIISPKTYGCKLCSLTYGVAGTEKRWAEFIRNLNVETKFLHKDEFAKDFPDFKEQLPTVYQELAGKLKRAISAQEINSCQNLEDLMNLVKTRCL